MEVELVVAGADDHLATLLREVGDAGVKLDVAVIFQRLSKMDELRERRTRLGWNLLREGVKEQTSINCLRACCPFRTIRGDASSLLSWSLSPAEISAAGAGLC